MSRLQISVVLAILSGTWLISVKAMHPVQMQEFMVAELGTYVARPQRMPAQGLEPEDRPWEAQATDLSENGLPEAIGQPDALTDPQAQAQILMLTRLD